MAIRKKAAVSLKKNHTKTYRADQAFAKTTGVGKTAQPSRGMNIFAKENIPKGYTVQKVKLKDGNYIAVVGGNGNIKKKPSLNEATGKPFGNGTVKKKPSLNEVTGKPTRVKKNPFKKSPRSR